MKTNYDIILLKSKQVAHIVARTCLPSACVHRLAWASTYAGILVCKNAGTLLLHSPELIQQISAV